MTAASRPGRKEKPENADKPPVGNGGLVVSVGQKGPFSEKST